MEKINYCLVLFLAIIPVIFMAVGPANSADQLSFDRVDKLEDYYQHHGYTVKKIAREPSAIVKSFPRDFPEIVSVKRKKKLFKKIVLPLVVLENKRLQHTRRWLLEIKEELNKEREIYGLKLAFVRRLLIHYELYEKPASLPENISLNDLNQLLKRVHTLPPSLVLAQAANESGWGTSRFCIKANNIFGEWIYNREAGLKPAGVPDSAPYRVKVFPNLQASVRSYMHNLNTHWAYKDFRKLRAAQAGELNSLQLVQGLENYSERGQAYVKDISSLIRNNNYRRFDKLF